MVLGRTRDAWIVALLLCASWPVAVAEVAPAEGMDGGGQGLWVDPVLYEAEPDVPQVVLLGFESVPPVATHDWLEARGFALHAFEHVPIIVVVGDRDDLAVLRDAPGLVSMGANRELEWHQGPGAEGNNFATTGDVLTRADRARALGFDGNGIGVAVIDSGINGAHPGLLPKELGGPLVKSVKILVGGDVVSYSVPPSPVVVPVEDFLVSDTTSGHGTHTTHIVAGNPVANGTYLGRAPGAGLVSIGAGEGIFILWAVSAFDWVIEHKDEYNIRVVSNSYGVAGAYGALEPTNLASRAAYDAGIAVIWSAGNSGPAPDSMNAYSQAPHVLSVGAATAAGAVAEFSARGGAASAKPGPDLVAPGHNVVSARNAPAGAYLQGARTPQFEAEVMDPAALPLYRTDSGTSMAAPQVAGIAALVLQANPDLSVPELYDLLRDTARPVMGFETAAAGAGLVDAEAAVHAALGATPTLAEAVEPLVASWDGTTRVYPFHAALTGAPLAFYPARQPLHVPVRATATELDLLIEWTPRASVPLFVPGPTSEELGLRLQLYGPDGVLVQERWVPDFLMGPGAHRFLVDAPTLAAHQHSSWDAGHWKVVLYATAGEIVYDVVGRVTYPEATLPVPVYAPEPPLPPEPVLREPRGHIEIIGDEGFTAANGVRSGSGTAGDPYVIEGWDVDAEGLEGIALRGTTAHVVIRDVLVHGTTRPCLAVESSSNVRVENSEMTDCSWGFYVEQGSGNLVFEGNRVHGVENGMSAWAVTDLVVRDNVFEDIELFAYSQALGLPGVPQADPMNARTSANILLEGNTFRGDASNLRISDSTATNVRVRDNVFDGAAGIVLSMGSHHAVIDGTTWVQGEPNFRYLLGISDFEPGLVTSTIVDAGRDPTMDENGFVCFSNMRTLATPPYLNMDVKWVFGDGNSSQGDISPCHTYGDPLRSHEATMVVTIQREDLSLQTLRDSVVVHPAPGT